MLTFAIQIGSLFAVIYSRRWPAQNGTGGRSRTPSRAGESEPLSAERLWCPGLLAGIGLIVVFLVGIAAAVLGASLAGVGTDGIADSDALLGLPNQLWRAWLALAEAGAIGFAFATVARSPLAGVGAGIALYFVESFAGLLLPDVVRWMPFNAASAVIASADQSGLSGGAANPLESGVALIVVLAWLFGSLVVAAVYGERAEITG